MTKRVITGCQAACDIAAEVAFVIPSYQRQYVWSGEDVKKLFSDIISAADAGENAYYIGTILTGRRVSETEHKDVTIYELVDGQQRLTTLMLLALAFKKLLPESTLAQWATLNDRPRLSFAIRPQVEALFGIFAQVKDDSRPAPEIVATNKYVKHLAEALNTLSVEIKQLQTTIAQDSTLPPYQRITSLEQVADYIYRNVVWVNNQMPASMDLNQLFATMNTSGVQLEQTDILKSFLMQGITQQKQTYEAIWQACEDLGDYFERNLRNVFPKASRPELSVKDINQFDPSAFYVDSDAFSENEASALTIADLAVNRPPGGRAKKGNSADDDDDDAPSCSSVLGFPLLLLHTLRIFNARRGQRDIKVRLHSDRLLDAFEPLIKSAKQEQNEGEIREFFELLWQVRYQFDRWVMKRVNLEDDSASQYRLFSMGDSPSQGRSRLSRRSDESEENKLIVQLQSVRLFTGDRSALNWLTPFLYWCIEHPEASAAEARTQLESIDNQLSLAQSTQKDASYAMASEATINLKPISDEITYLNGDEGTDFNHYWFQKLEYILWKNRRTVFNTDKESIKDKIEQYRIASRSSIEHLHARKQENRNTLPPKTLDSFGNLALLSPSENSSAGNQTIRKKRADFLDKPSWPSLKLWHMFVNHEENDWEMDRVIAEIKRHQKVMLELLEKHYTSNPP